MAKSRSSKTARAFAFYGLDAGACGAVSVKLTVLPKSPACGPRHHTVKPWVIARGAFPEWRPTWVVCVSKKRPGSPRKAAEQVAAEYASADCGRT